MTGNSGDVLTSRLLVLAVFASLWWSVRSLNAPIADITGASGAERSVLQPTERDVDADCNSLTGPFCLHTRSMTFFEAHMTPISPFDSQKGNGEASSLIPGVTNEDMADWTVERSKTCFFQHFASSWMDSGGAVNDLMKQKVETVDECEKLCCEHAQCRSFTFWRGHTCFLRAKSKTPRADGDSFSGIRLT
ncbi:hypothetical protein BBJ28_00004483 [Nothophytophthora sp. Chile5]|nr:hypothetical protein BBJ28_00004483 [Nothophytophthora sp. Chile5]